MNLRLAVTIGALAGGLVVAARRKAQKAQADSALWAAATDPIAPSGQS